MVTDSRKSGFMWTDTRKSGFMWTLEGETKREREVYMYKYRENIKQRETYRESEKHEHTDET